MSAKPWAEPGLTPEERANALVAAVAMPLVPEIVQAMRAVRADALEEAASAVEAYKEKMFLEVEAAELAAVVRSLKDDAS